MKYFSKSIIILIASVVILTVFSSGCQNDDSSNSNTNLDSQITQTENRSSEYNNSSKWGIVFNGKSIGLPCKLSDLERNDMSLSNEFDSETILKSSNQTFSMIPLSYGEDTPSICIKIKTGNSPELGSNNAIVCAIIVSNELESSVFSLKNNIAMNSSIDDVISTFGSDYNIVSMDEDYHIGYVMMNYGTENSGSIFHFNEGKLCYIEVKENGDV